MDDLDAYVGRVARLGGRVAVPKMAIPGLGWLAYAKDTERNIFGIGRTRTRSDDPVMETEKRVPRV